MKRLPSTTLALGLLLCATAPAAAPAKKCVIEPAPTVLASTIAAAPCHLPSKGVEQAVRTEITKRFRPVHEGGAAAVAFSCDGLGPQVREITIEQGGGHGGSLSIWRALRRADGKYDVRGIAYRGGSMVRPAPNPPFELASGVVALPDLAKARAALSASVSENWLPTPPNRSRRMSFSSSTHDFHLVVRLVDGDGRVLERRYTGYEDSRHQDRTLGLELAREALTPMTSLATARQPPDATDQALFVERFNSAAPHFDDQFYWWVKERYVDLARYLGTSATVRGLLTRLATSKPGRSESDTRANAVDALARITGWDAREGGASVEDAAARYLAECAAPPAP